MRTKVIVCAWLCVGLAWPFVAAQSDKPSGLLVSNTPMSLTVGTDTARVTIAPDGAVTLAEGYTPTDGARAFWAAVTQVKANQITVEVSPARMAALKWWGSTHENVTPGELLLEFAEGRMGEIERRHEVFLAQAEAEEVKALKARLVNLPPAKCAALAKDLGVAITSLPCGGGL